MNELYLHYIDTDGFEQSVTVDSDEFIIGRHSECDLMIPDSRLSREHLRIERQGKYFVLSDLNSSNGSTLDGRDLVGESDLGDEGSFVLGDAVTISYRCDPTEEKDEKESSAPQVTTPAAAATVSTSDSSNTGSALGPALIIAPVLGLFIILAVGLVAIFYMDGATSERTSGTNEYESPYETRTPFDDLVVDPTLDSTNTPANQATPTVNGSLTPTPMGTATSLPEGVNPTGDNTPVSGIDRKTEALVYSFMRKIANNDNRPYLTTPRFKEVAARANRFRGSAALASNIRNASSNAAQIRTIAAEKNLRPELLAAAAIARLGNRSGNVAAKANEMSGVLDKLSIVLGNELADDAILVIAAYDEGKAGRNLSMRNRLANLARKNPTASPREIRTVWFLKEKGEISSAQYDFALNFLAIGTIAQNPKNFNVNSEALKLE